MIDEEINVPKGSDETMLKKVLAKHAKHTNFAAPKPKDLNANLVFIVIHYAGAVPYNVSGFLEKNKDALHEVRRRPSLPMLRGHLPPCHAPALVLPPNTCHACRTLSRLSTRRSARSSPSF